MSEPTTSEPSSAFETANVDPNRSIMSEPTTSEFSAAFEKADLGILFVHGIGQQKKAETLISFGEPLRKWLADWISGDDTHGADETVRVLDTHLQIDRLIGEPSHARFRIRTGDDTKDWVIAESWWAESFPAPKYIDLLRWALIALPLTVASHFGRRLRQAFKRLKASSEQVAVLEAWFQLFLALIQAAVFIAILPIVGAVVTLVLAVGLLPIPKLRTWLLAAQSVLLGTVGDSYLFLSSALRGSSMASRVLVDLRWLRSRCRRTVIIAHSQGAAVAHAALQTAALYETAPATDGFISFGAGLSKLKDLENVTWQRIVGAWALSLAIIAFSTVLWRTVNWLWTGPPSGLALAHALGNPTTEVLGVELTDVFGIDLLAAWWIGPVVAGAILGLLQGAAVIVLNKEYRSLESLLGLFMLTLIYVVGGVVFFAVIQASGIVFVAAWIGILTALLLHTPPNSGRELALRQPIPWVDLYASADPVSNGPILDEPDDSIVCSKEVENRSSALWDHITYWQNREQFVSAVVGHIAPISDMAVDRLQPWDREFLDRARQRRSWRIKWLRVGRVLTLAAVALPAIGWQELLFSQNAAAPSVLHTFLTKAAHLLNALPFVQIDVSLLSPMATRGLLWIGLVAVALILLVTLSLAWHWWDEFDNSALCKRQSYLFAPLPFAALILLLFAYLVTSALVLPNWDRIGAAIASDPWWIAMIAYYRGEIAYFPRYPITIGPAMASVFAVISAVAAGIYYVMFWMFRRPWGDSSGRGLSGFVVRRAGPAILAGMVSMLIVIPLQYLSIWRGIFTAVALMLLGAVLGAAVCYAASLAYRFMREPWILRVVSATGAGPMGLWLMTRPDSEEIIRKFAQEQILTAAKDPKQRHAESIADELEKVFIVRRAFCGTQKPEDCAFGLEYARTFPEAALEMASWLREQQPALAKEILSSHLEDRMLYVRRAIRKALAKVGGS